MKLVNRILVIVSMLCLSVALQAYASDAAASGLNVGDEAPAFDPTHVSGPDRGTTTCPMCAYGDGQGVMIWVNDDDLKDTVKMTQRFEREIQAKGLDRMRVFVIYMNPRKLSEKDAKTALGDFANLKNVAVTFVPSPTDPKTSAAYKINPDRDVKNTVLVYHQRKIVDKFVNLGVKEMDLDRVVAAVDRAANAK